MANPSTTIERPAILKGWTGPSNVFSGDGTIQRFNANNSLLETEIIPTRILLKNIWRTHTEQEVMSSLRSLGITRPYKFRFVYDNGIARGRGASSWKCGEIQFETAEDAKRVLKGVNAKPACPCCDIKLEA